MSESKRKRGRPTNKIQYDNEKILGLIDRPNNNGAIIELTYADPIIFKQGFELFNKHDIDITQIRFYEDSVYIIAIKYDSIDPNKVEIMDIINVNCKKVSSYFTKKEEKIIELKCRDIYEITSKLDTNMRDFTMYLHKFDKDSKLHIKIKLSTISSVAHYKLYLTENSKITEIHFPPISNYPIKFRVKPSILKKLISDMFKGSSEFSLDKNGLDPLTLSYKTDRLEANLPLSDDLFSIQSNIDDNDIFSITVKKDSVHPFTNLNFKSDYIYIYADKTQKFALRSHLNNDSIIITSYIEIKKYN